MEQVRLLIAIVLSLIVFLVWNHFFVVPQMDQQKNIQAGQKKQKKKDRKSDQEIIKSTNKKEDNAISQEFNVLFSKEKKRPARTITVNTEKYIVKISEEDAGIVSFVLKDYFENVSSDAKRKELIKLKQNIKSLILFFENEGPEKFKENYFKVLTEDDNIFVKNKNYQLSFIQNRSTGLQIKKTFIFQPDSYLIDLDVVIKNNSGQTISDKIGLRLTQRKNNSKQSYIFEGPSALVDGKLNQVKIKKNKTPDIINGKIQWIAFEDRYFMTNLIAKEPKQSSMRVVIGEKKLFNEYIGPEIEIENNNYKKFNYAIFFGPKKQNLLEKLDFKLSYVVNFGFFNFLAKPFLWFMNLIHSIIPNYGVSIIILTIVTKVLLWPLGNKSYKSMNEMKRLQPLMQEIREKYKNDKTKMNQEMMGLYKTYKINPLGGCLPMILQIPVFLALYKMLYQAIELRHAPFIWWINDLSAPDRLLDFDFSIPLMQPPYGIPVLTIIMGATMLLQQKMSPPPGDPAQAKMMMIMPIVFTFIFINFSSGLVLYWLVNNILSIGQQYYIKKKYA
jgi:YidC/Oxa1 family membrane protein insertase